MPGALRRSYGAFIMCTIESDMLGYEERGTVADPTGRSSSASSSSSRRQWSPPDAETTRKLSALIKGMVFMIIGNFFMAWVFAHNISAWDIVQHTPPPPGVEPMPAMTPMSNVITSAVFTWLGFFFPIDLGRVAWERKSWTLFFIDTVYHLLSLFVVAAILIFMK